MNVHDRVRASAGVTVYLLVAALLLAAFSCQGTGGVKYSPIVPVATFTADAGSTDVVADVRSNFDVTVVRASVYGVAGFRDAYTGVWLLPPSVVEPGFTYVWRRAPKFEERFAPDAPLPAWVAESPGLWLPGEAERLGYVFETEQ